MAAALRVVYSPYDEERVLSYIYKYEEKNVYVCICIYIYTYIDIYVCIYIYIYIHKPQPLKQVEAAVRGAALPRSARGSPHLLR